MCMTANIHVGEFIKSQDIEKISLSADKSNILYYTKNLHIQLAEETITIEEYEVLGKLSFFLNPKSDKLVFVFTTHDPFMAVKIKEFSQTNRFHNGLIESGLSRPLDSLTKFDSIFYHGRTYSLTFMETGLEGNPAYTFIISLDKRSQ